MNEENLIISVQEYECLYNLQHRDYDNNLVKENVWKEIGNKLNCTVEECKSKWTMLRSYYRRALGRRKTVTGQAAKKIKKWRFEEQMQFLKDYLQERETQSNITYDEEEVEVDAEPLDIPAPSPSTSITSSSNSSKRKKNQDSSSLTHTLTKFIESRNTTDNMSSGKKKLLVFFEDIAETMLKFSELDQAQIKREIFNVVNKKEIDILRRRQESTQLTPIHNRDTSTPVGNTTYSDQRLSAYDCVDYDTYNNQVQGYFSQSSSSSNNPHIFK